VYYYEVDQPFTYIYKEDKKMKTLRALGLVAILTLTIGVGVSAQGVTGTQAPGTWSSSINLQNPNSEIAQVVIAFYDSDGDKVLPLVLRAY
jgi:hypothetical protein